MESFASVLGERLVDCVTAVAACAALYLVPAAIYWGITKLVKSIKAKRRTQLTQETIRTYWPSRNQPADNPQAAQIGNNLAVHYANRQICEFRQIGDRIYHISSWHDDYRQRLADICHDYANTVSRNNPDKAGSILAVIAEAQTLDAKFKDCIDAEILKATYGDYPDAIGTTRIDWLAEQHPTDYFKYDRKTKLSIIGKDGNSVKLCENGETLAGAVCFEIHSMFLRTVGEQRTIADQQVQCVNAIYGTNYTGMEIARREQSSFMFYASMLGYPLASILSTRKNKDAAKKIIELFSTAAICFMDLAPEPKHEFQTLAYIQKLMIYCGLAPYAWQNWYDLAPPQRNTATAQPAKTGDDSSEFIERCRRKKDEGKIGADVLEVIERALGR